ncbi:hypothetical protein DFH09DRAFT_1316121 [Mycena vulgaris]|nr:hypothetical protein DFH09DRAFT_1316121 [Mycena vulgaris]
MHISISCVDEVDPYKKPAEVLEVSPKGLVPGLKLYRYTPARGLNESFVILEYFEECVCRVLPVPGQYLDALLAAFAASTTKRSLLPTDPYARVLVRLQCDHISCAIVPAFYRFLQAQEEEAQIECGKDFRAGFDGLIAMLERAEREIVQSGGDAGVGEQRALRAGLGLWLENGDLNLTDVRQTVSILSLFTPLLGLFRASNVLKHYRGTEELYFDSYQRYAQNRPNTSQVANAINSGKPLP